MIAHSSQEYRLAVARALSGADDGLVFNGTVDHARVVVEEAFKVATSYVRILSNQLSAACYGSPAIIDAATAFLQRPDTRLDILIEDPSAISLSNAGGLANPFVVSILGAGGTRVRILGVPAEMVPSYKFNFMTVDDRAFRYEEDRSKPIAVLGGGESARHTVAHLVGLFDGLFARCKPFELTLQPA